MQQTLKHSSMTCKIKVDSQKTGHFIAQHIGEETTVYLWLALPVVTSCNCQCHHRQFKHPFRNFWHQNRHGNVYRSCAVSWRCSIPTCVSVQNECIFSELHVLSISQEAVSVHLHTTQTMLYRVIMLCGCGRWVEIDLLRPVRWWTCRLIWKLKCDSDIKKRRNVSCDV